MNGNDLQALPQVFVEQFGNAGLHITDNLFRTLALTEVIVQVLQIVIEQYIGILIDVIYGASQIDSQCLFHNGLLD